jgi:hypothetical protein
VPTRREGGARRSGNQVLVCDEESVEPEGQLKLRPKRTTLPGPSGAGSFALPALVGRNNHHLSPLSLLD